MRYITYFLLAILAAMLSLGLEKAFSHDHGRPDLNFWFRGLQSKAKIYCCDGSDAKSLDDVDWDTKDDHYRVRIDGKWVDVPPEAVVDEPNKAGKAMVWPFTYPDGTMVIHCFIPGVET